MCSIKTCLLFLILIIVSKSRRMSGRMSGSRNSVGEGYGRRQGKFEGFIVGGRFADILDFPHSVYMSIQCLREEIQEFACGGSIINQVMLLTAAHCFEECRPGTKIIVTVGQADKNKDQNHKVTAFVSHPSYDPLLMKHDIALAMLAVPLKFSSSVKRVVLSKVGIYDQPAMLAGWGVTDVIFFYIYKF